MRSTLQDRVEALLHLKTELANPSEYTQAVIHRASCENIWFSKDNISRAIDALVNGMLDESALNLMIKTYSIDDTIVSKNVGVIMAGNIPLVGFHDWLCVFLCGHQAQVKLSSQDLYLLPELVRLIEEYNPELKAQTTFVEKLKEFQGVIATGSSNTNRYFEYYFRDVPTILRKSRISVAVMNGTESDSEIHALGDDVHSYFGLGCRNVNKIYWPEGYDKDRLFDIFMQFKDVMSTSKYHNNYDYNFAMWSLNRNLFYTNDSLLFKEDKAMHARIASVFYEEYEDINLLKSSLAQMDDIQCIISQQGEFIEGSIPFGESQRPGILDYADGVDTMQFLLSID